MAIREILKMGDERLLRIAEPVRTFDTPELHALVSDMLDTMQAANGAGLAAPQIGVNLQVVIFGSGQPNLRYPDAPPVPRTVLLNPVITPMGTDKEEGWRAACRCPGCGAWCRAGVASATAVSTCRAGRSSAKPRAFMHAWCSMSVIT